MQHYKIKIKGFESKTELWIPVTAATLREAVLKAHQRCTEGKDVFYALEETIQEISRKEYQHMIQHH